MKCYFCGVTGAIMQNQDFVFAKPCCPICKQKIELCKQFSSMNEIINSCFTSQTFLAAAQTSAASAGPGAGPDPAAPETPAR